MAKIPQYDSQLSPGVANYTDEAPSVKINPEALTQSSKALGQLGESVSDVSQKLYVLQAQGELSRANTEVYKGRMTIESSEDTNPQGWIERRDKELSDLRENVYKSMTNPLARNQFESEFDRDVLETQFKLKKQHTTLTIGDTLQKFYDERQAVEGAIFSGVTPQNEQKEIAKIGARYAEFGRTGAMTPQTALKEYRDWKAGIPKSRFNYDKGRDMATSLEDSYVYNQLKLGDEGIYSGMSKEEQGKSIEELQVKINRNKKMFEFQQGINQTQNLAQMIVAQSEGSLTLDQIKIGMLSGDIKSKDGEHLIKQSKEVPAVETDYSVYAKIREMQAGGTSVDEINKTILDNSDKITPQDTKALIDKTFSEQDKNRNMRIKFSVDALKGWTQKNLSLMPEASSEIAFDFFNRIDKEKAQGTRIDEILMETQKDYIKKFNPDTALLEDVPNIIADRNHIQKVFDKESKIKNKQAPKQVSPVIGNSGVDFDDL